MKTPKKELLTILCLILATGAALAYVGSRPGEGPTPSHDPTEPYDDGTVALDARLSQTKVLLGSDGRVSMSLRMTAAPGHEADRSEIPVDLVVVLDRSGSMEGPKIGDARSAIVQLLGRLTTKDRLAVVSYANDVRTDVGLLPVDGANRARLADAVSRLRAGGGTNLGGGLQRGIDLISAVAVDGRQRKVILISDGLANQGVTDPVDLGHMASAAPEAHFSVSSVGVGLDFNEVLMTTLADHGAGRYYFLENPKAFARVFEEEFLSARQVAADGLQVRVPLANGVRLIDAGGYPIDYQGREAVFYPGDLLSGQQRSLFLTFAVPTDREKEIAIGGLELRYRGHGLDKTIYAPMKWTVACVADPSRVAASVDKTTWTRKVLQDDFSRLKAGVADAIRKGERQAAMEKIRAYEMQTSEINASVGSAEVRKNIDENVQQLRDDVKETFAGAPAAVKIKRKQQAKKLQYDSYQKQRAKN